MVINMKFKKITSILLTVCMLFSFAVMLSSCEPNEPGDSVIPESPNAVYKITVTDHNGNVPDVDVLIEVLKKDGTSAGMKKAKEGVAEFDLLKDDYTFVPKTSGKEFYFNESDCVLSAEKHSATVKLYTKSTESYPVYPPNYKDDDGMNNKYDAPLLGEGATHVEIPRAEMSYYLFVPSRGGKYKVSVISDKSVDIGYYGNPHVVQNMKLLETIDNYFQINIYNSSVTEDPSSGSIVIGLASEEAKDAIIIVERYDDPDKVLQDTVLEPTELKEAFPRTDYLNHKLVDVSFTDPSVKIIYNESDGYYHYGTSNGPIVYARITSARKGVLAGSFFSICEKTRMYKNFFDENGVLVKKEVYNKLINDYAEYCDSNGVYPLTKELEYAIKSNGEQMKWWVFGEGGNNIFEYDFDGNGTGIKESDVVKGNEWMFALCYVEEFVYGEKSAIHLIPEDEKELYIIVKDEYPIEFKAEAKAVLTVKNASGLTVSYAGQNYTADADGFIEIEMNSTDITFTFSVSDQSEYIFLFETL